MWVLSSLRARPRCRSHSSQSVFGRFGLFAGVAHDDEVVGIPDQRQGVAGRLGTVGAART